MVKMKKDAIFSLFPFLFLYFLYKFYFFFTFFVPKLFFFYIAIEHVLYLQNINIYKIYATKQMKWGTKMNEIVMNEVFIRGMLVGRYQHEDKTTAVICARSSNKEHKNYQYVTFYDDLKTVVDQMKICDKVVVKAKAYIYRERTTKAINTNNLRLQGTSIELAVSFSKRVLASAGVPIYGIQILDCARFSFSGTIMNISKTKNNKISLLLAVPDEDSDGYNLIPLIYSGKGEDSINEILSKYKKGQIISVKGFISQKMFESTEDGKTIHQYKNTYFITSFLSSEMDADFDELT